MLDIWVPHATEIKDHPLYRLDARHLKPGRTLPSLVRYSRTWMLRIGVVVVSMWLLVVINEVLRQTPQRPYAYAVVSNDIISWLTLISLGASFILDFTSILASVDVINREKRNGNWDLIRLTALPQQDVIAVKHITAQLNAWRITIIIISLRFSIALLWLLHEFLLSNYISGSAWQMLNYLLYSGIIWLTCIAEPLWRMRAITAIGMAISARWRSTTSVLLAGFGAVVGVWIAQVMLFAFIIWGMFQVIGGIPPESEWIVGLIVLGFVLVLAAMLYGYYGGLRLLALRRAEIDAFRD